MEGLRIAPEGQGIYKNTVRPRNHTDTEYDEEAWPVDLEEVRRRTPMGNSDPEWGWKDLSWANRPVANRPVADQPVAVKPKRKNRANKKRRNRSKKRGRPKNT